MVIAVDARQASRMVGDRAWLVRSMQMSGTRFLRYACLQKSTCNICRQLVRQTKASAATHSTSP